MTPETDFDFEFEESVYRAFGYPALFLGLGVMLLVSREMAHWPGSVQLFALLVSALPPVVIVCWGRSIRVRRDPGPLRTIERARPPRDPHAMP